MRFCILLWFIFSPIHAYSSLPINPKLEEDRINSQDINWPQWRGPHRNGVTKATNLINKFPEDGPPILWKRELGDSYSSVVIKDHQLYTMYAKGDYEFAISFDTQNGAEVWRYRVDNIFLNRRGTGSRSTPTVKNDQVYFVSARGELHALRIYDGKRVWKVDFERAFQTDTPRWGVAASPLVYEDVVIVPVQARSGCEIVAFRCETGEVKWRTDTSPAVGLSDDVGYSSPMVMNLLGEHQIIAFTAKQLVGLSPIGKVLWRFEWKTRYGANVMTPLQVSDDRVFISSGYGKGAALIQIARRDSVYDVLQVWKNKVMRNRFSSPVFSDTYIYGFDRTSLKCVDAKTGKEMWSEGGFGQGTLIMAGDQLIVLSENGQLYLVEASPKGYHENSKTRVLGRFKSWTEPSLASGRLYIRNQYEIICLDLRAKSAAKLPQEN